jgi:DNA-binding beta-propeller fold protein YncE
LGLLALLVLVAVVPALLGWRLIAEYAAVPTLPVSLERELPLFGGGLPPPAAAEGVVVTSAGRIFVADQGARRLVAFDSAEAPNAKLVAPGPGRPSVDRPYALAVAPGDRICLLDTATGEVQVFDTAGALLRSLPIGTPGSRALAADGDGNLYVGETGAQRIRKFLPDGHLDDSWGDGSQPGTVRLPGVVGLAIADSLLFAVSDVRHTVTVFDPGGRVRTAQRLTGNPHALAAAPDGRLYVSDLGTNRVWVLDRAGNTVARAVGADGREEIFARPRGVAGTADGRLLVVNENRVSVYRLGASARP